MRRPSVRKPPLKGAKAPRTFMRRRPLVETPQPPRHIYRRPEGGEASHQETLCGIKAECGACKYVNLDYAKSLTEKHTLGVNMLKDAGVLGTARSLPPVPSPRLFGYRSHFKLAVRPLPASKQVSTAPILKSAPKNLAHEDDEVDEAVVAVVAERFVIGLFAQGSHDVVDMLDCPLHAEPLRRLLRDLRSELNKSPLTPFDETSHTGQVRYITARASHLTGELMITFVVTEPLKLELRRLIDQLKRRGHKINSAHMNIHAERGNAIFGPETIRLAGTDRLRERIMDLDFEIAPTSFFQINPWQAINLYRRVEQIAGPAVGESSSAVAWDLYCGIGQISLVLARLGYKTLGIEENPEAIVAAQDNAKKNHLENKATFIASRVEDAQRSVPTWARSPGLIVVNPSRRGLAAETRLEIAGLLKAYPETRFLYVSCDVETLTRDLKEIKAESGFQVRQVEAFDMFAQTSNMEWLTVMTR